MIIGAEKRPSAEPLPQAADALGNNSPSSVPHPHAEAEEEEEGGGQEEDEEDVR